MNKLIDLAFNRDRVVMILLALILMIGSFAYFRIARES